MINNNPKLDISWESIFKIFFTLLLFYLLYLTKDILIWIIFALIISLLLNPAIDFLERKRVPRAISTAIIYLTIVGILGLLIYLIAPLFITEIQQFTQIFPQYFEKLTLPLKMLGIEAFESFENFTKITQEWLIKASTSILNAISAIFGGIFSTLTIFSLAFFFSLEEGGIEKTISLLFPKKYESYTLDLLQKSQNKVASWFGIKILASLFVGVVTFLTCYFFNLKYAISLGLAAGVLDIIPIIGPLIAGIIIVILAALESWIKALFLFIAFVLIQQIEANIIIPILSKKFIRLPPALVLISVMVGGKLLGILGAIFAIPLAGMIYEFLKDFLERRREGEEEII